MKRITFNKITSLGIFPSGAATLVTVFLLTSSPAMHAQELRSGPSYEEQRSAETVTVRDLSIPPNAFENHQRGLQQLVKQNAAKSIPFFAKAIQKYPGYYEAYYHLGIAQQRLGQDDQALDSFQKAIDFSRGKYAPAEYSYALELSKHGKAKDAERIVRYALELGQNRPLGDIALGTVLLHLHRVDEAERVARDALSLDSTAREAYLVLAGVHRERADYATEVLYLDAFLNLEPQGRRAQKVREIRNAIEGLALHTFADRSAQIATISSNP